MVKCETCDIRVPAHSEFVIEGEVPLTEFEDEGPYGEMYGYLGPPKPNNFFMNIKAITHRHKPWVLNSFTGLTCDMPRAPQIASNFFLYKKLIPSLTGLISPRGANGVVVISIDKKFAGEGMAAGQYVAANAGLNKVVIVVDKDLNILDPSQILHALGARWQPSASLLIPADPDDDAGPEPAALGPVEQDGDRRHAPVARRGWPQELGRLEPGPAFPGRAGGIRPR